jgi:hypothetical protein
VGFGGQCAARLNDEDIGHLIAAARSATITNGWPAVMSITSTLPRVERFIPELLPVAIRDYVMDIADRQQSPPDFVAVSAICAIAAVVGTVYVSDRNRMTIGKSCQTWGERL